MSQPITPEAALTLVQTVARRHNEQLENAEAVGDAERAQQLQELLGQDAAAIAQLREEPEQAAAVADRYRELLDTLDKN